MTTRERMAELGPETRVKLGVVLGCAIVSAPGVWWAATQMAGQRQQLERIQQSIDAAAIDRYSGTDHDAFAARLAENNPDLRVPYWRDLRAGRVVRDVRAVTEPK